MTIKPYGEVFEVNDHGRAVDIQNVANHGPVRLGTKLYAEEALDEALAAQREKLATHFEKHEFIQGKFVAKLIRESGE